MRHVLLVASYPREWADISDPTYAAANRLDLKTNHRLCGWNFKLPQYQKMSQYQKRLYLDDTEHEL